MQEPTITMRAVVSFTGGKDSCLVLTLLQLKAGSPHVSVTRDERLCQLPATCVRDGTACEVMGLVTFAPKGVCGS